MSFREHMPMMTGVGLYFALFYAASTKPHIVDVTSVSDVLDSCFILLFGMRVREHMPMMTGAGLYFP